MKQKNITITKTARYFVLGELNKQTESIWIVCHGYGQLANFFLKKFNLLNNGKNVIIAPEALHRFYQSGFTGRVGASWMTKEERTDEIKDYVNYLDIIYREEILPILNTNKNIQLNIFGFSQATATVCRWIESKKPKVNNLILWGGLFPHDLQFENSKKYFNSLNTYLFLGKEDEYYSAESVEKHLKMLNEYAYKYRFIHYNGKHEIPENVLVELLNLMQSSQTATKTI